MNNGTQRVNESSDRIEDVVDKNDEERTEAERGAFIDRAPVRKARNFFSTELKVTVYADISTRGSREFKDVERNDIEAGIS
ncbi:uncharacterized protein RAG0_14300 [Rhynchosporium agropyri]|uniref:Uncharacterized protein n=1 Tax=Rhynchosporium agropyri TaxID=914238 RepID=A0A1E1LGF9_9HELO|nr:uncharacterized protein RAG0_14300 [Rhynchosporium agropyri]